jgi:hypothetical protein
MFGSNVQPKKIIRESPKESWSCMKCSTENKRYMVKCSSCGERRDG